MAFKQKQKFEWKAANLQPFVKLSQENNSILNIIEKEELYGKVWGKQ